MKDGRILREISAILSVSQDDIPKTIMRFKMEIEEMKAIR